MQIPIHKLQAPKVVAVDKIYNLEERTFQFAKECRFLVKSLKKSIENIEDGRQLVKSSGSIGANYIEANEKLGDKDLKFRLKNC